MESRPAPVEPALELDDPDQPNAPAPDDAELREDLGEEEGARHPESARGLLGPKREPRNRSDRTCERQGWRILVADPDRSLTAG